MSDSKTAKSVEVVPTLRETVQALVNAYLKEKVGEKVTMDGEVVVALTDLAQEFLKSVVKSSKEISKHRGGKTLEVRDVALHLKNEWNIQIPVRSSRAISKRRILTLIFYSINLCRVIRGFEEPE